MKIELIKSKEDIAIFFFSEIVTWLSSGTLEVGVLRRLQQQQPPLAARGWTCIPSTIQFGAQICKSPPPRASIIRGPVSYEEPLTLQEVTHTILTATEAGWTRFLLPALDEGKHWLVTFILHHFLFLWLLYWLVVSLKANVTVRYQRTGLSP